MEIITKGKARGSFMWKLLQKERPGVHLCGNCYKGKGQGSCGNCDKRKGQGFIYVEIVTKGKARVHVEIVTKEKARGLFMWKLLQRDRLGVCSCENCYKGKG